MYTIFLKGLESGMSALTYIFRGNSEEVLQHLSGILRNLNHESVDVRLLALGRLRYALHHNQAAVHHLTTALDYVHPTVSELFSALLGKCFAYKKFFLGPGVMPSYDWLPFLMTSQH